MPNFNQVTLIGHLTRDPQLKYLPSQIAICEFGIASSRKFKTGSGEQREEVAFVDCAIFGKGGEVFNQYMNKGAPVFITGRLKYDSWEDKNGGGKRSKLTVVVEDFQFLGGKGGASGDEQPAAGHGEENQTQTPRRPMGKRPAAANNPPVAPYGDEQAFNDDDIPFASASK